MQDSSVWASNDCPQLLRNAIGEDRGPENQSQNMTPIAPLRFEHDEAVYKKLEDEAEQDDGSMIDDDEQLGIPLGSSASATSLIQESEKGSKDFCHEDEDLHEFGLENSISSLSSAASCLEQLRQTSGLAHYVMGSAEPACSDDDDEMLGDDSDNGLRPYPGIPHFSSDEVSSSSTSHHRLITPETPASSLQSRQRSTQEPFCNNTDHSESLEPDARIVDDLFDPFHSADPMSYGGHGILGHVKSHMPPVVMKLASTVTTS